MSMRLSVDLPRVTNINFLLTITGTKKISAQGKTKWKKIHARQYSFYGLKKSYKEFDNDKKLLRLENSPPPITFLMVRP